MINDFLRKLAKLSAVISLAGKGEIADAIQQIRVLVGFVKTSLRFCKNKSSAL